MKPKTCAEWTKKREPCGRPATHEYDVNTTLTRVKAKFADGRRVKPEWVPVCQRHAVQVLKTYGFVTRARLEVRA